MAKIRLQTRYTLLCYIIQFTAARLKCHIKNANLTLRYRSKEALSTEILCKTIVWCTDWEYHLFGMCSHCFIFVWKIALVYIPYFFCQVKNCPALWPACVKATCVMIAAISFCVTPCAFAFCKWNFREESVIPEAINATTVIMLLVFTSMS